MIFFRRRRPDEVHAALARCIAAQIAAGLMLDADHGVGVGRHERAIRLERDRARNCLMVAGAMLAGSTSDEAALNTLQLAGAIYRDEADVRVRTR